MLLLKRSAVVFIIISALTGCGYHLRGSGDALPEDVKTLAIVNFKNNTYEADVESLISVALSNEFSRSRRLAMVSEADADLILKGSIIAFKNSPVSFSSSDVATDYRLQITLDISLKRKDGDELWRDKSVVETADYKSLAGNVAVTQSKRLIQFIILFDRHNILRFWTAQDSL